MPNKRKTKKVQFLKWKKHRSSFTYEIVDPITRGLWILTANRAMTDEELFRHLQMLLAFYGVERPKFGQSWVVRIRG